MQSYLNIGDLYFFEKRLGKLLDKLDFLHKMEHAKDFGFDYDRTELGYWQNKVYQHTFV